MASDYYDILGVSPEAGAEEIKKAFRLLALKWHPDRNPGDLRAKERFLRLGEAYRVLSNPARRAAYDWLRRQGQGDGRTGQRSAQGAYREAGTASKGGIGRARGRPRPSRAHFSPEAQSVRPRAGAASRLFPRGLSDRGWSQSLFSWWPSMKDWPQRFLHWLTGCPPPDLEWQVVSTPHHPDLVLELKLPRRLAARGTRLSFTIKGINFRRRLKIRIPAGIKDGSCLRVKGGGKAALPRRGHLYINIRLKD